MYFLDETALKHDLATRQVPSADVAIYLFLVLGGQIPVWYPAPFPEESGFAADPIALLSGLASIVVMLFGVRAAWRANGANGGCLFAEKFVSLGWVAGFQIALAALPVHLLFALWRPAWTLEWTPAFWVALQLLYYWRVWTLFLGTKQIEDARRMASP